jgi:hypothetical protein
MIDDLMMDDDECLLQFRKPCPETFLLVLFCCLCHEAHCYYHAVCLMFIYDDYMMMKLDDEMPCCCSKTLENSQKKPYDLCCMLLSGCYENVTKCYAVVCWSNVVWMLEIP